MVVQTQFDELHEISIPYRIENMVVGIDAKHDKIVHILGKYASSERAGAICDALIETSGMGGNMPLAMPEK